MADDIDIEEHDVLENPVIKNIFPDISVLKKEILEYYEDVSNIKQEQELAITDEKLLIHPVTHIEADTNIIRTPQDNTSNAASNTCGNVYDNLKSTFQGTKIILGSKPNKGIEQTNVTNIRKEQTTSLVASKRAKSSLQDTQLSTLPVVCKKTDESREKINKNFLKGHVPKVTGVNSESADILKMPFQSTKIILGSKPVQQALELENNNRRQIKSLESLKQIQIPNILLQDIGEYVFNSDRYCKECKTLFTSKTKFYEHKQSSHTTKAINRPANSNDLNTIKTRNKDIKTKPKSTNKCTECGSCFHNLYNLSRHYINVHKKKISFKRANENKKSLMCNVCGSCFKSKAGLITHYINTHRKVMTTFKYNNKTDGLKINSRMLSEYPLSIQHKLDPKSNTNLSRRKCKNLNVRTISEDMSEITSFKCTICCSYFSNRSNLMRHYKNVHRRKVSLKQILHTSKVNQFTNSSLDIPINKTLQSNSQTVNCSTKNSCYHCNAEFPDQESVIEHLYKILEPKDYPNLNRRRIKTPLMKNIKPETKRLKKGLDDIDSDEIGTAKPVFKTLRDKLTFENEDLDKCESSTSSREKIRNDCCNIKKVKEPEDDSNTLDEQHREIDSSSNKKLSVIGFQPTSSAISQSKNKRKYENLHALNANKNNESNDSDLSQVTKKQKIYTVGNSTESLETSEIAKPRTLNDQSSFENTGTKSIHESNKIPGDQSVYECIYCSYILPTLRAYCAHVIGKHKVEHIPKVYKVTLDKKCKYCPSKSNNVSAHNTHVYRYHYDLLTKSFADESEGREWEEGTNTLQHPEFKRVKSFVLKSIIYKCGKCDIHFLSSCVAKDHEKHMELLINWKCPICKKIFKKHDKPLHLKQHNFSKTMNVCQFNETELSRLLYNCTKCAIHFTEERYLEHYPKCDIQTTDSVYCKKCDILIDKVGYSSHEAHHRMGKSTEDFIIMIGDIITSSNIIEQDNEVPKKKRRLYEQINCLTFCDSCKCYLSDIAIGRKVHIERSCSQIVRYTCKLCGLVLTNKTINTHRQHHKKQKNLKLQDFKFFDLNGFQIRPPIPDYPRCSNCEIIFVHKNAVSSHICSEMEYLICQICNVKLTESAFKLHMNFHTYCMPNESKGLNKFNFPTKSREQGMQSNKNSRFIPNQDAEMSNINKLDVPLSKESHERDCKLSVSNKLKTEKPQSDGITTVRTKSQTHDTKIDKPTLNSELHNALPKTNELLVDNATSEVKSDSHQIVLHTAIQKHSTASEMPLKSLELGTVIECEYRDKYKEQKRKIGLTDSHHENKIIYSCQSCGIAIDSYDNVIQHCQNHFSLTPTTSFSLKICPTCSLKFEVDNYENHQKLHLLYDTNDIQHLTFDPTYFTADNKIWTQHVFASVSPALRKEIINKSMYPHECRIKMEIVQRGPSRLTVYKCCRCGNFIDPTCLIAHIKETCHKKIRKYPCSVCGLPLSSGEFRSNHERIHKKYENIRLKSYKIMLINCETHKNVNDGIIKACNKYILYQCRGCDGIVGKSQRHSHQCNVDVLQKCNDCGLILYKEDFSRHTTKHTELPMYNTDNIKVVLFGNKHIMSTDNKKLFPTFNGIVCDYKLYKCSKCEVCVNDQKFVSRHVCVFDDSKWKCPKCSLYISSRCIKQHIKMHDLETEYRIENFEIILFTKDGSSEKRPSEPENDERCIISTKLNNISSTLSAKSNYEKESVTLYKCACGLHYVDETTAKNHADECSPKMKITKQNCSKCSLVFNPKELFTHIITHHSDKNKTFKYNIIQITSEID